MLWWTLRQLKSKNWWTREQAARKLGERRDARGAEPLVVALEDEKCYVREAAAEALGNIKDVQSVELLVKALKDEHHPFIHQPPMLVYGGDIVYFGVANQMREAISEEVRIPKIPRSGIPKIGTFGTSNPRIKAEISI